MAGHRAAVKKFGNLKGNDAVWPGLMDAIDKQTDTFAKRVLLHGLFFGLLGGDGYVGLAAERLLFS